MENSLEQLLREIDVFMRTAGYSDTRFGEECLNDRHLIHRLRKGSDIKLSTVDKIRQFIEKETAKRSRAAKRKRAKRDNRRTSAI